MGQDGHEAPGTQQLIDRLKVWSASFEDREVLLDATSQFTLTVGGSTESVVETDHRIVFRDHGENRLIVSEAHSRPALSSKAAENHTFLARLIQNDRAVLAQWTKYSGSKSGKPQIYLSAQLRSIDPHDGFRYGLSPFIFGISNTLDTSDRIPVPLWKIFANGNPELARSETGFVLSCSPSPGESYEIVFDRETLNPAQVTYHADTDRGFVVTGASVEVEDKRITQEIELRYAESDSPVPVAARMTNTTDLTIAGETPKTKTNTGKVTISLAKNCRPIEREIRFAGFTIPNGTVVSVEGEENIRYEYHDGDIYKMKDDRGLVSLDGVEFTPRRWPGLYAWLGAITLLLVVGLVLYSRTRAAR